METAFLSSSHLCWFYYCDFSFFGRNILIHCCLPFFTSSCIFLLTFPYHTAQSLAIVCIIYRFFTARTTNFTGPINGSQWINNENAWNIFINTFSFLVFFFLVIFGRTFDYFQNSNRSSLVIYYTNFIKWKIEIWLLLPLIYFSHEHNIFVQRFDT